MGELDEATARALNEARHAGAVREGSAEGRHQVDDATWEDLDLPLVFRALDTATSPLGTLILYGWLRRPATTAAELEAVQARLATAQELEVAPAATAALARALRLLPRLPQLLVETVWGAGRLPSLGVLPRVLAAVALLAPLGFLMSLNVGLAAMAAAFVVNLAAHFWWNRRVFAATASIDFLAAALRCASALGDEPSLGRSGERLRALSARLVVLSRAAREAATPLGVDDLVEYLRLYFLTRERRLSACAALVSQWRGELQALFQLLGELDAAVAAGAFRRAQPRWCVPEWSGGGPLVLESVRHPLLGADAVPSTLELDGGLVVTGSNMSGKSTFLRAVGLNQLLAQSLGFSCAFAHRGPVLEVATSLRATDGLVEGKSYYLAEAQRLGAILARARPGLLVLVDEPFRGTNSTERIAASVAVLRYARRAGALVVAATHDLEVTRLLDGAYQQGHFRDGLDASGLRFDYTLRGGVATEHNALRLLSFLGYPASLVAEAQALADGPHGAHAHGLWVKGDGSGR
jgi:hypothetical protein